tara:strand:- start:2697 stop:3317 length:621 start_codon:yes stop_codon:yes gene_type:complete
MELNTKPNYLYNKGGYLGIIVGPMFSGKTTRLIQLYKTRTYIQKNVVVLNYIGDKRYSSDKLSTHDGIQIPCIFIEDIHNLWFDKNNEYYTNIHLADTILINEAQMFPNLMEIVLDMVDNSKKEVFICGLDGDYKRQEFGDILKLLPFCDKIEKLSSLCAFCKDGTPAIFSHRTTQETQQIVVGSSNYKPLCRNCYLVYNNLKKND